MAQNLPDTMTAIEIGEPGGPGVLRATQRPVPRPQAGEVLIEVAVAGVNRPDCLQRAGRYAPPPDASDLPGLEVAGRVVAVGVGVDDWRTGDPVCALVHGGGYAEYCVAPGGQCLPLPAGFDMAQAAALPENHFTVWTNVFDRGRLCAGETLLVHGGASGIGTTAIQLARALGAQVIATAGGKRKVAVCRELGADRAVDYREEDFVEAVKAFTEGRGADVILDMVGGDYLARDLEVLAVDGRLVLIAFLRGSRVSLDLAPLMVRRQTITGSTLRPQSIEAKTAIARALRETVWPLLAAGTVRPVIDRILPLAEAARAHEIMEANENIGKLLLRVRD
ncbi:MAG: NAD(P)H-quinone oxidoreductase [Candidatus Competibacterales bacterium]|nr:NAD(P)H-quinone oxidoreductase [Candidatus Competibacterales bacterium]